MALSERERRLLEEMEAALASDDPRLQSTLTASPKISGSLLRGVALLAIGFAILFTGLISQITPLGIAGFAIALTGVISGVRSLGSGAPRVGGKAKSARRSLNDRLQERWDQRNFE